MNHSELMICIKLNTDTSSSEWYLSFKVHPIFWDKK